MKVTVKALLWTAGILASLSLAGCGGSSSSSTSAPLAPRIASSVLPDGLTATLTEDRTTVPVGGTVTYTITLTNSTTAPITYQGIYGPGSGPPVPAFVEVTNQSGNLAYPLQATTNVVYIGQSATLAPGQSVSETQVVSTSPNVGAPMTPGYSLPGAYKASASFALIPGTTPNAAQGIGATAGPVGVLVH